MPQRPRRPQQGQQGDEPTTAIPRARPRNTGDEPTTAIPTQRSKEPDTEKINTQETDEERQRLPRKREGPPGGGVSAQDVLRREGRI
jgi:trehalose monomycolate/heme transporter